MKSLLTMAFLLLSATTFANEDCKRYLIENGETSEFREEIIRSVFMERGFEIIRVKQVSAELGEDFKSVSVFTQDSAGAAAEIKITGHAVKGNRMSGYMQMSFSSSKKSMFGNKSKDQSKVISQLQSMIPECR